MALVDSKSLTKRSIKKGNQVKTVGTLQNQNYDITSWNAQILGSLSWSWHSQGNLQVYHVSEKIQSSTITEKNTKIVFNFYAVTQNFLLAVA